mmetsp:Transcript_27978/g.39783  ORF Transcript_27978/g.39783 Transcript_27978/m.39783 type:complete len:623 (-) Transcript_27978:7-1875(-)
MNLKTFCGIFCAYYIPTVIYITNNGKSISSSISNIVAADTVGHKRRRHYGGSMRTEMFRWSTDITTVKPSRSLLTDKSDLYSYWTVDESASLEGQKVISETHFIESEDLKKTSTVSVFDISIEIDIKAFPYVLILHDTYEYDTTIEKIAISQHSSSRGETNKFSAELALVRLIVRPVADMETVNELVGNGMDISSLPVLSYSTEHTGLKELAAKHTQHYRSKATEREVKANVQVKLFLEEAIPSLKMAAVDPDNIMRVITIKMSVLYPPTQIGFQECKSCRKNNKNGYFNPSFALWQGKVLSVWGDPTTGVIQMAWYNGSHHPNPNRNPKQRLVTEELLSLGPDQIEDNIKDGYLGLGPGTAHPHLDKSVHGPSVVYLVDARLLPLSDGSLHVTYTSVQLPQIVNIQYVVISPPKDMSGHSSASISHPHQLGDGQKNWVTFETDDGHIYHLQRINPMHVVEATLNNESDSSATAEVKIRSIYQEDQKVPLPWHERFGSELRGGTPAVRVTDMNGNPLYLAIFHTKAYCQHPFKMFTYFMGAMTMCPNSPFRIHTISKHPIITGDIYDGPWLWNTADYVFYPAGLIVEDGVVWISAGYQNRQLRVYQLDLQRLLHSLDYVADC